MKNFSQSAQSGFSAVELLITLFIASIFLFAGYQLYTQVLKDGTDASKTAQISNLTYERMRAKAAEVTESASAGCTASNEGTTVEPQTVAGFSSVSYSITVDCPYNNAGSISDLFYIRVTTTYHDGVSQKTLSHATYAT